MSKLRSDMSVEKLNQLSDGRLPGMFGLEMTEGSWGFSVLKRHNTTQPPWFLVSRGVLT